MASREGPEDRRSFLLELSDAVRPLAEPEEIQRVVGPLLGRHLGANRVHYAEVLPEGTAVIAQEYVDDVPDGVGRYDVADFGVAEAELRTGRTFVVDDVADDPRLPSPERDAFASLRTRSAVVVPLVKDGRLVAVLAVHRNRPHDWTTDEVGLVEETAERTWAAVAQALLESALRKSETRLRLALEAAAMGSYAWFPAEDRGEPDEQMLALFGLPPDRSVQPGEMFEALVHPDDRERYAAAVAASLDPSSDGHMHEEVRVVHPSGDERWLAITGYVTFSGEPPEAVLMAGVAIDVTARKRAEVELQRLTDRLEVKIDERTQQARRLARELALAEQHERDRLSHILHDDLQQQLFGIQLKLGHACADIQRGELEAVADALTEADGWLTRCIAVTRQLSVDLSPPVLEHESFGDVLEWLVRQMADIHDLTVELHTAGALPAITKSSRLVLFQIVRELLFNVVKHAETDTATIALSREDDELAIVVTDDGRGFDASMVGTGATELGMGLASIRERVELLGGEMSVESSPGAGTRVTVRAPIERGDSGT